ncbi:uroporphyrinogen decarboxylase family protein [candidate division KSB1 bacterium]|nr:uroporphyrinogen decarboxylase family protein [candidate division KSB1 bacterium]
MKKNFSPNIGNLYRILKREKTERPVLFEFLIDDSILRRHARIFQRAEKGTIAYFAMVIKAFQNLGYDYAPIYPWDTNTLAFEKAHHDSQASYSLNEAALITDRASFERYDWPDPNNGDYRVYEKISAYLPDGMKLMACSYGGLLENAIDICGFDNLCMMTLLEKDLAREIFDHIGKRLVDYYNIVAAFDSVGFCVVNDDWGFKTQTVLSPTLMREYIFPWTRKMIKVIHAHGKPVVFHSCGNLKIIMDAVIDDLKIDAKHSFEDSIYPVEDAYDWWGNRIALLGGIDVDFLCAKTPAEIKARARRLLAKTADAGGYALGSGNSITAYVPEENYLAMISVVEEF